MRCWLTAAAAAVLCSYNGAELSDDSVQLKAHYFARMHGGLNKNHGFKWSYPYAGIVWITPNRPTPSNEAIKKYKPATANVVRRAQVGASE